MDAALDKRYDPARDACLCLSELNSPDVLLRCDKYRPSVLNRYKLLSLKKENVFRYGFSIFRLWTRASRNVRPERDVTLRLDLFDKFRLDKHVPVSFSNFAKKNTHTSGKEQQSVSSWYECINIDCELKGRNKKIRKNSEIESKFIMFRHKRRVRQPSRRDSLNFSIKKNIYTQLYLFDFICTSLENNPWTNLHWIRA